MSKPSVSQVKASNATTTWAYRPIAVFVGGTSGIGEATARALATATKGRVHIIIVGRSRPRAEAIFASFPKTAESQYDFIECDVSDTNKIVEASKIMKSKAFGGSVNYLVLSQGISVLAPPKKSLNGMDLRFVLNVYSRWKFVDELAPLLQQAGAKGEEARVMTVLSPDGGSAIDLSDLGMRKTTFGISLAKASTTYTNILLEENAKTYPDVAFFNMFPGVVNTPNMDSAAWWVQPFLVLARRFIMISPEETGERMLSALLNPEYRKGPFYLDQYTNQVDATKEDEAISKAVLDHYRTEVSV